MKVKRKEQTGTVKRRPLHSTAKENVFVNITHMHCLKKRHDKYYARNLVFYGHKSANKIECATI